MATTLINSGSGTLVNGVAVVTAASVLSTDHISITRTSAIHAGPAVDCELGVRGADTVTNTSFTAVSWQKSAGSVNTDDNSTFTWAIIRTA